jgi:hypothetical protein
MALDARMRQLSRRVTATSGRDCVRRVLFSVLQQVRRGWYGDGELGRWKE